VLHVITTLHTGGAETMLCKLVQAFDPGQVYSGVISLTSGGPLLPGLLAAGAQVSALGIDGRVPSPSAVAALVRVARRFKPDVIHGWLTHGNLAAWLAARATGAPLVWNVRQALYDMKLEPLPTRLSIRVGARLSTATSSVIYNSADAARHHEGIGYDRLKTVVIPNGFDTTRFAPSVTARARFRQQYGLSEEHFVVGVVARVHQHKGHCDLLDAAALLVKERPHARFVLVGKGCEPGSQPLARWVESRGLADHVIFLGERSDLEGLYPAFDVSALASITESFPNVLGESMACGVPCAATDVGAAAELVGDTGRIVPAREPAALCSAFSALEAVGAAGRRRIGLAARRRIVEHFSIGGVAERFDQVSRAALRS
jgi:glycosyltransferase involved in cell wall biosynthesis